MMDEIDTTNQLKEACKIFMSSELFLTELECQAFFNHNVAFHILHDVEISSQGIYLVQENESSFHNHFSDSKSIVRSIFNRR